MADECDTIVYGLAKQGMWGGNPQLIWDAPTEMVLKMMNYINFTNQYQETEMLINTKEK